MQTVRINDGCLLPGLLVEKRLSSRLGLIGIWRWPLRRGTHVHALHLLFQSLYVFTSLLFTGPRLHVPILVLHLPRHLLLLLLHHLVVGRVLQLLRYLLDLTQPPKLIHVVVGHLVRGLVNGWARGRLHEIGRLELARLITGLLLLLLKGSWRLLLGHRILLHLILLVLGRGIQQKTLIRMECRLGCVFILAEEVPEVLHRLLQMRGLVLQTRQVLQLCRVHPLVQRTGHRGSEGRRDFLALLVRSGVPPLLGVRVHASARGTLLCDELNLLETILPLQGS